MSINKDLLGLDGDTPPVVSISASQSLTASLASHQPISTGLPRLDSALDDSLDQQRSGILRGRVTEVFGPPGVGKTSLALSITANALRDGGKVVWIDTASPLPIQRLQTMTPSLNDVIYFRTPTLPHLLALLMHPPKPFPPENTSLLILDSVSSLFPAYFPNAAELKSRLDQGKITDKQQLQWLLNRKWNVTSDLATHLARLAARGIAVLVINQTHTKIKGQPRATLHPSLAGQTWESSVSSRLVMYRDLPDARFVEVVKRNGRTLAQRMPELIVSFGIEKDGLRQVDDKLDEIESRLPEPTEPTPSRKRKAEEEEEEEEEVADSQDEEGGSEGEFQWMNELDPASND